MRRSAGQSLVELALCAPVVLMLTLGGVAIVRIEDGQSGLQAATGAAAQSAARAPDAAAAAADAQARFSAVIAAYPVRNATLELDTGDFARGVSITATGAGYTDAGWASMAGFHASVALRAQASVPVEWWRTHR